MKTTLFLVALLCLAAVVRPDDSVEVEEPVTDEQADCISAVLRGISVDTEHVGDFGEDVQTTVRRLLDQRQTCENILGDPPTPMQERLHEACRLAWSASVAYEMNRLRGNSQSGDFFDQVVQDIRDCRA